MVANYFIKIIPCFIIILIFLMSLPSFYLSSYSEKYQLPINISGYVKDATNPQIVVTGDNVYSLWIGLGGGTEEQSDIYYRASSNGGVTFGDIINLSNDRGSSFNPQLAVSGKNVYVVWQDGTGETGNTHILFRRSLDGGSTFDRTVTIGKYFGISSRPAIFASENSVYLLWQDLKPSSEQIYYARSIDLGRSFSFPISISKGTDLDSINVKAYAPTDSKKVYVLWTEGNFNEGRTTIIFRASSDGGGTFAPPIKLSTTGKFATNPVIGTGGENVYTIWKEGLYDKGDIRFRASADQGATFNKTQTLSSDANSSDSILFAYGSNVYTAWIFHPQDGREEVAFRSSHDSGSTFGKTTILSNKLLNSSRPEISGDNDSVYVIWESGNGASSDIVLIKSTDKGLTFGEPLILQHGKGSSPAITVYGGKAYFVWQKNSFGKHSIIFSKET